MKAFKEFWSDYWNLCKETGKWYKKHWLGYIILTVVLTIPVYLFITFDYWSGKITEIKNSIKSKVSKKNKEVTEYEF